VECHAHQQRHHPEDQRQGDVEFTDDESDVKSISSGGWFVDRRVGGIGGFFASDSKRFEAREHNAPVERKFYVDGRELGADEAASGSHVPAGDAA
jgi:hypothetical protein